MAFYRILNPCSGSAILSVSLYGDASKEVFTGLLASDFLQKNPRFEVNKNYLAPLFIEGERLDEALVCNRGTEYILYLHASQAILTKLKEYFTSCSVEQQHNAPDETAQYKALRLARSRYACHVLASTTGDELRAEIEDALENNNADALQKIAQRGEYALLAQNPPSLFLVGPTNAGKSTFFNLMADKELALVSDISYTTRDALSCSVILAGLEVEIYDTPGSGSFDGAQEDEKSYAHFETLLSDADILLRFHPFDEDIPTTIDTAENILHLFSKLDVAREDQKNNIPEGALAFSATTGEGVEELKTALVQKLYPHTPPRLGESLCFSRKQWEIVTELCRMLEAGSQKNAMELYKNNETIFR